MSEANQQLFPWKNFHEPLRIHPCLSCFWLCSITHDGFVGLVIHPIPSMYGIFAYIWLMFMVRYGKYTIDGWYDMVCIYPPASSKQPFDSHLRHRACVSVTSWRGDGGWGEKELEQNFLSSRGEE